MTDIRRATMAAFEKGGVLQRVMESRGRPFRATQEQIAYAEHIAGILSMPSPRLKARGHVSMVEAETGVGKTLGYLIPLALRCALSGERGIVSTYTNMLAKQVCFDDGPIAVEVVSEITGKTLRIAPRIGRANFIDYDRVAGMIAALDKRQVVELAQGNDAEVGRIESLRSVLGEWLDARDLSGFPRTFMEANDFNLRLPDGVSKSQFCLLRSSETEAQTYYKEHIAASRDADIVVTNHTLLLLHSWLRNGRILDGSAGRSSVVVSDEADTLPSVAASLMDRRISLFELSRLLEKAGCNTQRVEDHSKRLWNLISGLDIDDPVVIDGHDPRHVAIMEEAEKIAGILTWVISSIKNDATLDEVRKDIEDIEKDIRAWVVQFKGSLKAADAAEIDAAFTQHVIPMLSTSPVRAFPSLVLRQNKPAGIIRSLGKPDEDGVVEIENMILTSATLSSRSEPGGNVSAPDRMFMDIRGSLGYLMSKESRGQGLTDTTGFVATNNRSFAPSSFGRLDFVLADRSVPVPMLKKDAPDDDSDEVMEINSDWIKYVADGVLAAHEQAKSGDTDNRRTLVLTNSHRDTERLVEELEALGWNEHLLIHKPDTSLEPLVDRYKADPEAILITPSAWAGLNLPGMVRHLIIPKVPFSPPDVEGRAALAYILRRRGKDESEADNMVYYSNLNRMKRKLRQGIGRGIRQRNDHCTLWLLDPRFPLPARIAADPTNPRSGQVKTALSSDLLDCIPSRFRKGLKPSRQETFERATIFPRSR